MKNYTNTGFTRFQNNIYESILVLASKLTGREYRVINLIIRLTLGCGVEWATLKKSDFKIVGIGITHAGGVLEKLLKKGYLLKQNFKEYKLNNDLLENMAFCQRERIERLKRVVGVQLENRKYLLGITKLTFQVENIVPLKETGSYSNGNNIGRPKNGDLNLISDKSNYPKDINNKEKNKEIPKEIIVRPNNKENKQGYTRIDPYTFTPQSSTQEIALNTWYRVEPRNPESFNFYIWAAHKGLPSEQFMEFGDIATSKNNIDQGKYFNGMVMNYLREQGLISDK